MGKVIRENGKIWLVEAEKVYGTWNVRKTLMGEYEEEKEDKPIKKKAKKEDEN